MSKLFCPELVEGGAANELWIRGGGRGRGGGRRGLVGVMGVCWGRGIATPL